MQAELKAKWVEALRSGKYKQGKSVLRTPTDEYCCLGVLCDVVAPAGWLEIGTRFERVGINHQMASPIDLGMIESSHRQNLGIAWPAHKLASMNDNGKTFAEIADYIEANIPADAATV